MTKFEISRPTKATVEARLDKRATHVVCGAERCGARLFAISIPLPEVEEGKIWEDPGEVPDYAIGFDTPGLVNVADEVSYGQPLNDPIWRMNGHGRRHLRRDQWLASGNPNADRRLADDARRRLSEQQQHRDRRGTGHHGSSRRGSSRDQTNHFRVGIDSSMECPTCGRFNRLGEALEEQARQWRLSQVAGIPRATPEERAEREREQHRQYLISLGMDEAEVDEKEWEEEYLRKLLRALEERAEQKWEDKPE